MFRATLLGKKTWHALRLIGPQRLVVCDARKTKLLGRLDNRRAVDTNPAQHLVFDQEHVVRVEEFAVAEERAEDSRRLGVEDALLPQGEKLGGMSLHGSPGLSTEMYSDICRCQLLQSCLPRNNHAWNALITEMRQGLAALFRLHQRRYLSYIYTPGY